MAVDMDCRDGDGRLDLVLATKMHAELWLANDLDIMTVAKGGRRLLWPKALPDNAWRPHQLGASLHWFDLIAVDDVDADGRLDIVYTEETQDWDYNARIGWLSAPADRNKEKWSNHTIAVLRSVNSIDLHDVDGDGRIDLIVGEHTDMRAGQAARDTFTGVLFNRGYAPRRGY
jgi:ketosteroid isomerase-like protein